MSKIRSQLENMLAGSGQGYAGQPQPQQLPVGMNMGAAAQPVSQIHAPSHGVMGGVAPQFATPQAVAPPNPNPIAPVYGPPNPYGGQQYAEQPPQQAQHQAQPSYGAVTSAGIAPTGMPAMAGPAYGPPLPAEQNGAGAALDQVHSSLERLAHKISTLSGGSGAAATHSQAGDPSALLSNINQGLESLSGQMTQMREHQTGHLDRELERISRGLSSLESSNTLSPQSIEQIRGEMGALRQGVERLQNSAPNFDLSGVSQSIESGYSDIVQRLDHYFANTPSTSQSSVDFTGDFNVLSGKLEDVAQAVVELSTNPIGANASQDAFDRIEARLSSLARSVDNFQQGMAPQSGAPASDGGHFDAIAKRLEQFEGEIGIIAESLEQFGHSHIDAEQHFGAIETRLAELADRFDRFSANTALAAEFSGDDTVGVLRELVGRIDALEGLDGKAGAKRFELLERQLDEIASQLGSVGHNGTVDLSPISKRLDNIEGFLANGIHVDGQAVDFAPLAGRLGAIENMLDTAIKATPSVAADLQPLVARLEQIEGQIATSRDVVMDIAAETVRNAVKEAGSGNAAPVNDERLNALDNLDHLGGMIEEVRRIGASIEQGRAQDSQQLSGIVSSISNLYERLDQIAQNAAQNPAIQDPAIQDPAMVSTATAASPPMMVQGDPMQAAPVDLSAAAPPLQPAGVAGNMVPGEDVPLQPGSGMPDLEALVRRASNGKRETAVPVTEDGNLSDLMVNARKAAQAASLGTQSPENTAGNSISPSVKTGMSGILGKSGLIGIAAVILMVIGSFVVVPKILGTSKKIGKSEEIAAVNPVVVNPVKDAAQTSLAESADGALDDESLDNENLNNENLNSDIAASADAGKIAQPRTQVDTQDDIASNQSSVEIPDASNIDNAKGDVEQANAAAGAEENGSDDGSKLNIPQGAATPANIANVALTKAANGGDGNALFEIGRRLTEGEGVERDLASAAKWFQKAADMGHVPAQYRLGNFYENGHGVTQDFAIAAGWYQRAADAGNALAMHNLAVLNARGDMGKTPDMARALELFEKAANYGVKDSQVNLGILYTKGMGVKADLEAAYKWFSIAAKGGDNDAASKRDMLADHLGPEVLRRARSEAQLWKPATLDRDANVHTIAPQWRGVGTDKANGKSSDITASIADRNASRQMILKAQQMLARIGFEVGQPDGLMGPRTANAIKQFQREHGLRVDGKVSNSLLNALGKLAI